MKIPQNRSKKTPYAQVKKRMLQSKKFTQKTVPNKFYKIMVQKFTTHKLK